MRYKIIANPAAGKGAASRLIPQVVQSLQSYSLDFDLVLTERPWQAAELAQAAAAEGYDVVVAAGGDGTCNEVLNGLMRAREAGTGQPCMGVICIGRGNDFAYGAGIPTHWRQGIRALAEGRQAKIDIGRLNGDCLNGGRYFGNGIGIGFDTVVNIQATRTRLRGFLGYTVAALRTILLHFQSPLVQIDFDEGGLTQPSLMISIMNGRRMGGGFFMAPQGASDDGLFDLCVAHKVSRLTILMMIPRFMMGTQAGHPAIRFLRSRKVTVTALEGLLPVHADGETLCENARQVTVELLPGQVEVFRLPEGSRS